MRAGRASPVSRPLPSKGLAFVVALLAAGVCAGEQPDPRGIWLNKKETVAVEIAACGEGRSLCGDIVWLKKPYDKSGELKRDDGRPLCGMTVLRDMAPHGDRTWQGGTVYDPDGGATYRSRLTLENPDTLEIHGYVLVPLLGKTLVWQRISSPPGHCPTGADPNSAATATPVMHAGAYANVR